MRHSLLLALLCHFVLAGGYWSVTPALEAPREEEYLENASLCALQGGARDAYTMLLAVRLGQLGQTDLIATALPADGPGALRLRHGLDEVLLTDEQRALSALRALSILLGAISVVCAHRVACLVFPGTGVAAVASLAMASMPQWACSHAVLWHGALLAAAAHFALLCCVRGLARGRFAVHDGALGGLGAGLALATAPAGWFIVVVGTLAHALALRKNIKCAATWGSLGAFALFAGAGWLTFGSTPPLPTLHVPERGGLELVRSFVGEFGRTALPLPWPILLVTLLVIGLSVAGFFVGAARLAPQRAALMVLSLSCSLGTVAGVQAASVDGMHGRNLLIALGPMLMLTGAGLVAGWRRFLPPSVRCVMCHPVAVLVPFLPSLLVLMLQVAPNARSGPVADPRFATLHGGLRTMAGMQDWASMFGKEGNDSVIAAAPTTLSRTLVSFDFAYSVLGWRDDYRLVFATYERDGQSLAEPSWPMSDAVFDRLQPGERMSWRVRTLPDLRLRASTMLTTPRWFTRAP